MNYKFFRAIIGLSSFLVLMIPGFSQISEYSRLSDTLFSLEEVQIVTDRLGLPETSNRKTCYRCKGQ